jgi:ketosteroid isomerase-like protein
MLEENRALMDRYFSAWKAGDREALAACYADDLVMHHQGAGPLTAETRGKDAFFELIGRIYHAAPGAEIVEVHDALVGERHAVGLVRERLVNGRDEVLTNRVVVYELRDGLIAEIWTYDDDQVAVAAFFERHAT